jgi:hypothetical protein
MGKAVAAIDLEECDVTRGINGDYFGSVALLVSGNEFDAVASCRDVAISHRIAIS